MEQVQEAVEDPTELSAEDITVTVQVKELQLKLPVDATCKDLNNQMKHKFGCNVKQILNGSQLLAPDAKLPCDGGKILSIELEPYVRLNVIDEDGRQVQYKMHGDLPIGKMINKHCQHRSLIQENVRFHVNEVDLDPEQTLQSLGMAEGDIIYVVQRCWYDDDEIQSETQQQKKQKTELNP